MHKELFDQLVQVVATLRGENGCPWDKAQTHQTLKAELIEETYEVIEAIDAKTHRTSYRKNSATFSCKSCSMHKSQKIKAISASTK